MANQQNGSSQRRASKKETVYHLCYSFLVTDFLDRMLKMEARNKLTSGIGPQETTGENRCLQYADDTLIPSLLEVFQTSRSCYTHMNFLHASK